MARHRIYDDADVRRLYRIVLLRRVGLAWSRVYRVVPDALTQQRLDVLPTAALHARRGLRAVRDITPWNGQPSSPDVPDGVLTGTSGEHGESITYYPMQDCADRVEVFNVETRARERVRPEPEAQSSSPEVRTCNQNSGAGSVPIFRRSSSLGQQ